MEKSKTFYDTIVWQKAHQFVLDVYSFTSTFPKKEDYALTSQFRRAAISITANIAEGFIRQSNREKVRFYNISQGSLEECRNYLILSKDLRYGDPAILMENLDEVSRILRSYIHSIEINSSSTLNESHEDYSTNY